MDGRRPPGRRGKDDAVTSPPEPMRDPMREPMHDPMHDPMRDEVRRALALRPNASVAERTIDITTTGRRSGRLRRIEICFYRVDDAVYLSGIPSEHRRDWLANLADHPQFGFHLKHDIVADLDAEATVITDPVERRRILAPIVADFNERHTPESPWPRGDLDEWVAHSPLARVRFPDTDTDTDADTDTDTDTD